nr:ABC transporter permease [Marinicella sp. W31]MDC2878570.1 ABC transporter permease [Marinicella sp. W31]
MNRKDLGLAVLVFCVGAIVALVNPRFLSPINLANTANLIGLFGLFSIAEAFVIVTGGIELSVGSVIALLGVIFIDLIATHGVAWPVALAIVLVLAVFIGLLHGLLVTRLKLQPFVVTLCGLLIYRGIARFYTRDGTAGFSFGSDFPRSNISSPDALRAFRTLSSRLPLSRLFPGLCCIERFSAGIFLRWAKMKRPPAIPG